MSDPIRDKLVEIVTSGSSQAAPASDTSAATSAEQVSDNGRGRSSYLRQDLADKRANRQATQAKESAKLAANYDSTKGTRGEYDAQQAYNDTGYDSGGNAMSANDWYNSVSQRYAESQAKIKELTEQIDSKSRRDYYSTSAKENPDAEANKETAAAEVEALRQQLAQLTEQDSKLEMALGAARRYKEASDAKEQEDELKAQFNSRMQQNGYSTVKVYNEAMAAAEAVKKAKEEAEKRLEEAKKADYYKLEKTPVANGSAWRYVVDKEKRDSAIERAGRELAELTRRFEEANKFAGYAGNFITRDLGTAQRINQGWQLEQERFANARTKAENQAAQVDVDQQAYALEHRMGLEMQTHPTEEWSQDQRNQFYVRLRLYGEDNAASYAAGVNSAINDAKTQGDREAIAEIAANAAGKTSSKLGQDIVGVGMQVASLPSRVVSYLQKLESINQTGYYTGRDQLNYGDVADIYTQSRAGQINKEYGTADLGILGEKGVGDLYQLVPSMAQSILYGNIAGSAGTLAAFFFQAADQSFDEAKARGASDQNALVYSFLSGAAEAATEVFSVEQLLKGDWANSFAKQLAKQFGTEMSEEGMSAVLGVVNDKIAAMSSGEKTEIQNKIDSLVANGMSRQDAEKQVWKETVSNIAWEGLAGGLSGFGSGVVMGGPQAAVNRARNRLFEIQQQRAAERAATQTPAAPTASQTQTQPQNLLYDAMQGASKPAAVQTTQEAAGTQEAPASEIAQPQTQEAAQTVKPGESEATAPTPQQSTNTQRYREIQSRIDEINRQLDNATDEAEIERLSQEGEALYQEARQLESQPEVIQDQRVQNGEVSKGFGTAENHIDNRTAESVSKPSVKAFQFDHPELHQYFVDVARELIADVEYAEGITKAHMYELGSAIESGPIRELMDQGLTKPEIIKALQDIIANNGQENYAKAKKVERVLSQMMSDGWRDLKNQNHDAVPDYIAAKDAINGAVKSDSWEKYLADHETVLALGEVTEEQLRQDWEQMHPQEEAAAVTEPETATAEAEEASAEPATVQPVEAESAGEEQSAGTIPASEQTTAERTNGQGPERERNMAANLRQNEKAEPALRQDFDENRELYTQLTNAEVTQKAEAILAEGYEAARNAVQQAVGQAKAGMKLAPEIAVAGYHVATEMAKRGDIAAARELCSDIAAELTYSGQLSQIGRLIIAADPSIRISTVEKLVKKLNDGMSNRQKAKNVKQGKGTGSGNITVSDEALQRYAEAETEEAQNEALDAIEQEIADQIPATFRDKFTALRYLNMLGNLKTQARNIVGNTAMMAATNVKYLTQHVGELAASLVTGGKYQGNTALNTSKELRQQAADDFAAHVDEIKGDAKYSDVGREAAKGVQDKRTIFGAKTGNTLYDNTVGRVGKGLEAARKATNWAMDVGDEIFLRQVYVRSFAGWMKAHGVADVNSASAEQVSAAREFAKKEAQEATFHDSNQFSEFVSSIDANWDKGHSERVNKIGAAAKMITQGIMPFRKTPANVAVRAVEYSPVGAIGTIYEAIQAKKGNATAADVINSAAKNLTGTALFGIGMLMAAAGRARASGDEEDKELTAFQKMGGAMDYSVKVGDKYISLSQLAPMAIPFFMGIKLKELLEYNDNLFSADSIGDILGVVSDPMLEMSMLSGVNDLLNDISALNGDTDALPSLVANAALSYLTQGLTNTLLGQLEQASEKNRQTTYTDTKSADATALDRLLGKKQYQVSKATAKIPGVDYHQQDYVDAWGRTQSNGGAGERAFNALLNPTYISRDRSTKVDAELERLHSENRDKEGFPDVFPKKRSRSDVIGDGVVMTPDEYLEYEKAAGQKKLDLVSQFMDSSEYKGLTDEQRADVISNLYSFADNLALRSTRESYGIRKENDTYKLLSGTDKPGGAYDIPALQEKNAGEYIAFDTLYKGAVKSGDYSTIDNLLYRYSKLNENTRAVVDAKKPDDLSALLKFRDSGASAKDYYAIKDSIGEEQWNLDASSSTGSHVRLAGLGSADIPDSKKDKLVESGAFKLSSAAKNAYGVLRNAGLKPEQISEWFENADWYASGTGKEATADGSLNAYEVAVAISKMSGLDDSQREALYQQFKSALQKPNDAYDTWKSYNYWQTLGRSGNYGRTVGRESAPKSGNVLYDYYAERQRTG